MTERMPIDSGLDVAESRRHGTPRAPHLRWSLIGLVALGGTVGTAAREALTVAFPTDGVPITIGAVNIAGAFVLGLLLEVLARRGPDTGVRRSIRLTFGTGVLGGFTTYSALAADAAGLFSADPTAALAYAVGSVLLGGAASFVGIWVGSHVVRGTETPATETSDGEERS